MVTPAEMLYAYYDREKTRIDPIVYITLFGKNRMWETSSQSIDDILVMYEGLYKGLYLMGVSRKEIHHCFLANRLDELIHTKFSINKSDYYNSFVDTGFIIGKTSPLKEKTITKFKKTNKMPYCLTCVHPPYHYNNYIERDTEFDDDLCDYVFTSNICKNSLYDVEDVIKKKIEGYKQQDKLRNREITDKYISVEDVLTLLHKQDTKCYVCGDTMLTSEYVNKCLYQLTLDRIDNSLPHNRSNVLLCCYYCNCFNNGDYCNDGIDKTLIIKKMCMNDCHRLERNNIRPKDDVEQWEIDKLSLSWKNE